MCAFVHLTLRYAGVSHRSSLSTQLLEVVVVSFAPANALWGTGGTAEDACWGLEATAGGGHC